MHERENESLLASQQKTRGRKHLIRLLQSDDIGRLVEIHCERFPGYRTTDLGERFLRRMYTWFLVYMPDLALVAEVDGRVEGFILGSWGGYGRRIFRYTFSEIMWALVRKPALLCRRRTYAMWRSYLRGLVPSWAAGAPKNSPCHAEDGHGQSKTKMRTVSFASIAVAPNHTGIGMYLINALQKAALSGGADHLSTSVLTSNTELIRIFDRLGWRIHHQDERSTSLKKG